MKCPNCGQEFEGDRCPNCGWTASRGGNRTAAVIIAVLLALPAATVGACSAMIVASDPAAMKNVGGMYVICFALMALAVSAAAIVWAIWLWRK